MPTAIEPIERGPEAAAGAYIHASQTFAAPGSTDPVRLSHDIVVQISGTATAVDAVVERSFADPLFAANSFAPAEDEHFSGDLTVGIAARQFFEPIQAYYRVRVIAVSGGTAIVSLVGSTAQ